LGRFDGQFENSTYFFCFLIEAVCISLYVIIWEDRKAYTYYTFIYRLNGRDFLFNNDMIR